MEARVSFGFSEFTFDHLKNEPLKQTLISDNTVYFVLLTKGLLHSDWAGEVDFQQPEVVLL